MQVDLYKGFGKRLNSTKRPQTSAVIEVLPVTGDLRRPCSIMNPVIAIKEFQGTFTPELYTYAYISTWSRYYYVKDWSWENGLWVMYLAEDVLATFKTQIGTSSAYVARAASDSNGNIVDTFYPATADSDLSIVSLYSTYNGVAPSGGCFVMGIISPDSVIMSQVGGAVTYYVLTPAEMQSFLSYLLSNNFLDDNGYTINPQSFQQITQMAAKALVNPIQYITSCMWFPVSASTISGASTTIKLGLYDFITTHPSASYLDAVVYTGSISGTIPAHPQAATRGNYLNFSPYTRLSLNVQPFGTIPIDPSCYANGSYLYGKIYVDLITGKGSMRVECYPDSLHAGNGAVVCETSGSFGIPIQLAQMNLEFIGALTSAVNTAASAIAAYESGGAAGAIAAGVGGIGNMLDSVMPQMISQGVSGSFLQNVMPPILTVQHFKITDESNTEFGKPLCETKTINTLSGYIQCLHADIEFSCFDTEKREIETNLLKGFFYE